ncbi:response regulator transcription factor [Nocardiopsis sp. RSe5-2]|uniref:Response regulator transcription factor n=1 Tax=Nocardiopsis endophytica TaxID=3018445 RepID=A0ABT4UDP9_9ACTN|nr:response regulator transcription factor [Nocardiopsis endophytica]MDA2815033.1 response regulator transcription factor [Nocardiopsis endophytica]
MIRIVLADDEHLVRGAIAALLGLEEDLEVVAQVGRGDEVVGAVAEHGADVAVVDIEMPGATGIEAAARLADRRPGCGVLVLTSFGRPGYLRRALDAGVRGFVGKDAPVEELAGAIRTVHAGGKSIDAALAATALMAGDNPLTPRESDVLRAAADGRTVADMAADLGLARGTVRNHLSSAIGKTGTATRHEAAAKAHEMGWL